MSTPYAQIQQAHVWVKNETSITFPQINVDLLEQGLLKFALIPSGVLRLDVGGIQRLGK